MKVDSLERLVSLWAKLAPDALAPLLAEDFVWDHLGPASKREFLGKLRLGLGMSNVQLTGVVPGERQSAVFLTCVDPVTLIQHRMAWQVEGRDELVSRITVYDQVVLR